MIIRKLEEVKNYKLPVIKAKLISTEGSVPRNSGTFMIIGDNCIFGSIGGGQLEYYVINKSKEKLNIFYWINLINTNRPKSSNSETIIYEKVDLDKKIKNILKKRRFQRKVKIIKYFMSRYINVRNYLRFMRKTKS